MKLEPTNKAHILDIFNTYYGKVVKADSIVVHGGSFYCPLDTAHWPLVIKEPGNFQQSCDFFASIAKCMEMKF